MNENLLQTINNWLKTATKQLTTVGIATARLDCLVLLEDATRKDRSWLLAHPDKDVASLFGQGQNPCSLEVLEEWVKRRTAHEPLAYIRGRSEFYGREFLVNKHTLQPRPETETMIDLLNSHFSSLLEIRSLTDGRNVNGVVVDVGTGSGCLAITAKLLLPKTHVLATDISTECIQIAKQNSKNFEADVKFYKGDLLSPITKSCLGDVTVLLANLPYVPDSHTINQAAMHEPKSAIFGGVDGLDLYRRLFKQIDKLKIKPQLILTESLPNQHDELANIANSSHFKLIETNDFIQVLKYV